MANYAAAAGHEICLLGGLEAGSPDDTPYQRKQRPYVIGADALLAASGSFFGCVPRGGGAS